MPNLTVKAGRQLVVWGNYRMFGHFDWNNVGWSHDGLTAELSEFIDRNAVVSGDAVTQTWGYTQLWINF